jgi:hypothetical protein
MLAPDPCSLLDPVTATDSVRFADLSKDHDGQGGKATDTSRCEARLALTLEARGILKPPIVRPPWGEAEDGNGQVWDFKAPHSHAAIIHRINVSAAIAGDPPPDIPARGFAGEFDVRTEVRRAIAQQRLEKGVVFDVRRLSIEQARRLINAVAADPHIDPDLVRYFPTSNELVVLEGGD